MPESHSPTRPLWQRIIFAIVRIVVLGGGMFYLMAVTESQLIPVKDRPLMGIAIALALGLIAIAAYAAYAHFIERREPMELSLPGFIREWGVGALIGIGLYVACVVVLMVLGMYKIEGLNSWAYLLPAIPMAVKSGIFEELAFRGVLFKSVEDIAGSWIAIVVSSFVFGFLHLTNPGGTITGAIYITVEAGLLLAAAFMVTRRLWIAMGLHMAWNYVQSAVFSGVVSGGVTDPGLIRNSISGPDLLTGGSFGMESSLVAFILCTATGIIMLMIAVRRRHMVPPPWRQKR